MNVLTKARGTLRILRALPGQGRVPYLPRERIVALRDANARATVRYAAEHVPFYRDLFRRERIDPRELETADDLARLPLLDKELVHGSVEGFRSDEFGASELLPLRTSGRSGSWLEVAHDRTSLLRTIAHGERDRAVEARLCGRRFRYRVVEVRALDSSTGRIQSAYERTSFRPLRPRVRVIPIATPLPEVLRRLADWSPVVYRMYGSYAEAVFRTAAADGLPLHLPKVLVYSGDAMSDAGRAFIEERFGIPVVSRFSAVEAPRIGFMCEERTGFHLHEDLCHVRLIGPAGEDVAEGDRGEVVVSNLVNRGTVLLNYRLGDYARLGDGSCPCGRTFRRLEKLEGRVGEILHLGPGELVHQYALWHALAQLDDVVNFQLVQLEPRRFDLRLRTAGRQAFERVEPTARRRVAELLPGCVVETSYHEELVVERVNGKLNRILALP